MNNKVYISFIVTAYNLPASLLEECLNSIFSLSLSEEEREVIFVDDGSDISTVHEIGAYMDRIIYVREPNSGLSEARNRGMAIARGEYIQFVDGDDYLVQSPYEHCLDILRFHQPLDMVMFHYMLTTHHQFTASYTGPMTGVEFMRNNNIRSGACGYIFRKGLLGDLRFTKGIVHEDEEFTPQLLLKAQYVYDSPAEAYYYRQRKGSIMHTLTKESIDKRMDDFFNVILRLRALSTKESPYGQEALNRRLAQLSMDYLYNIIHLTHSEHRLNEAINALQKEGLYPLPDKDYTRRYQVFRKLVTHKLGRKMLLLAGPILP